QASFSALLYSAGNTHNIHSLSTSLSLSLALSFHIISHSLPFPVCPSLHMSLPSSLSPHLFPSPAFSLATSLSFFPSLSPYLFPPPSFFLSFSLSLSPSLSLPPSLRSCA